jgi:hypothetical protein
VGFGELIVEEFYKKNLERHGIRVEVFYQSLDGQKHYQERMSLNPAEAWRAMRIRPLHLSRLVNPVIKAAEKVNKAIDSHGYLKTKTFSERQRELTKNFEQTIGQAEEAQKAAERQKQNEQ